jgi:hypothetical protein
VTSVSAKCLWMPATTLSIIWGSILTQLLLPTLVKFSKLQCYNIWFLTGSQPPHWLQDASAREWNPSAARSDMKKLLRVPTVYSSRTDLKCLSCRSLERYWH